MAFDKNKIRYGLRNVHYAILTEGEESDTYGVVKKIPWCGKRVAGEDRHDGCLLR